VKPENILLEHKDENDLSVKITDFGFACFYEPGEGLKEVLGSPLYMAPEIIREDTYDEKVDTWSVGVITYILLSGRPPFKGKSKAEMFKAITTDELTFDEKHWRNISPEAKDFIRKALVKDSKSRADAK
jgi:calcium-dependent protein kinase